MLCRYHTTKRGYRPTAYLGRSQLKRGYYTSLLTKGCIGWIRRGTNYFMTMKPTNHTYTRTHRPQHIPCSNTLCNLSSPALASTPHGTGHTEVAPAEGATARAPSRIPKTAPRETRTRNTRSQTATAVTMSMMALLTKACLTKGRRQRRRCQRGHLIPRSPRADLKTEM